MPNSEPRAAFFKIPISPKFNAKKSRTINFETSFLAYDDKAAEHDVITIARSLALGITQKGTGWRGFWHRLSRAAPSSVRIKIIFVFDELDKLDDLIEPGAQSEVEKMLTGLKNLFTTSGICFLFIAGKDLHERWLRDVSRGDSVFESVFSYDKYLPCMWANGPRDRGLQFNQGRARFPADQQGRWNRDDPRQQHRKEAA